MFCLSYTDAKGAMVDVLDDLGNTWDSTPSKRYSTTQQLPASLIILFAT